MQLQMFSEREDFYLKLDTRSRAFHHLVQYADHTSSSSSFRDLTADFRLLSEDVTAIAKGAARDLERAATAIRLARPPNQRTPGSIRVVVGEEPLWLYPPSPVDAEVLEIHRLHQAFDQAARARQTILVWVVPELNRIEFVILRILKQAPQSVTLQMVREAVRNELVRMASLEDLTAELRSAIAADVAAVDTSSLDDAVQRLGRWDLLVRSGAELQSSPKLRMVRL